MRGQGRYSLTDAYISCPRLGPPYRHCPRFPVALRHGGSFKADVHDFERYRLDDRAGSDFADRSLA